MLKLGKGVKKQAFGKCSKTPKKLAMISLSANFNNNASGL